MQLTESSKESCLQESSYAFDVFLSYSRKDRGFAVRLEDALESYRIPKSVAGGKRRLNVFRDEADMVASEDYYRTIEWHLQVARKLVVICSPDARKSLFVEDEIRRFIKLHGEKNVIPVLVRGRANNETTDEDEKAFPEILCENKMPLAANFLGSESHKGKLSKGQFRGAWYSVLAAINGIDRRRLEQIDEKIQARRRNIGSNIYQFRDHGGPVLAGAFAPDGRTVMVMGQSGATHLYACELCCPQKELINLVEKRARRELSRDERVRYLRESGQP